MLRLRLLLISLVAFRHVEACTTVALGKEATADGSTIATFNADSSQLDSRMIFIPPKDHAPGAMRPVYASDGNYPRYVGVRSEMYAARSEAETVSIPIGHIPQVSHTYGYWEACYGFMNEKGLGFGESTAMAKIAAARKGLGGTALFGIDILMQVALERCDTARCAIETMGYWGQKHGFYGEDTAPSDSGETLTIVDGDETWVFHIMADFTGGAVWAAQIVPAKHAAVVANNFIIRSLNSKDREHGSSMWSDNVLEVSQELVRKGRAPARCSNLDTFDFLMCFGGDIRVETYDPGYGPADMPNPWYTTLRMWRVQSLLAPSLGYQPNDNAFDLPFSFPVDKPVTLLEVMDIQRDQLEGTQYDLSKGAMAGPHGDPNRDQGGADLLEVRGYYPRAISIIRSSYSVVCQSKKDSTNTAWIATHQPATSVYVPFFAKSSECHDSYARGGQGEFDRKSAWWVFSFVSNWMRLDWKSMHKSFVSPKLRQLQADLVEAAAHVTTDFTSKQTAMQGRVVEEWTRLGEFLVMAYNNGYLNFPKIATQHGYPEAWLRAIGFRETLEPLLVEPVGSKSLNLVAADAQGRSMIVAAAAAGFVAGGVLVASLAMLILGRRTHGDVSESKYHFLSGA